MRLARAGPNTVTANGASAGPSRGLPNSPLSQGPKSQPGGGSPGIPGMEIPGTGKLGQAPGRKHFPAMEPPPLRAPSIPPKIPPSPPPPPPPPKFRGKLSSGPSSRTYSKKVTPFMAKGIAATRPEGSTAPVGLFKTYPYRFKDWGLPISALPKYGSGDINRPHRPASKRATA